MSWNVKVGQENVCNWSFRVAFVHDMLGFLD